MIASSRTNLGRSTVKINESGKDQGIAQMLRRASTTKKKEQPSISELPYAASSDG